MSFVGGIMGSNPGEKASILTQGLIQISGKEGIKAEVRRSSASCVSKTIPVVNISLQPETTIPEEGPGIVKAKTDLRLKSL